MALSKSLNKQLEQLEETDKCPICRESFTDPRSLPCIHTFCCECISQCITTANKRPNDQMTCPMCRKDFSVPEGGGAGLPKNIFMVHTLDIKKLFSTISEEMACEVCETGSRAVKLCTTCLQKICEECCKSHQKIRTTQNHRLYNLKRSSEEPDEVAKMMSSFCKEHDERILEMYCSECGDIICLLCHALDHCGHSCMHVDEVAEIHRQQMERDINKVASAVDHDNGLVDKIQKDQIGLEMSLAKLKTDIADITEAMKSAIDSQGKDLVAKAEKMANERKRENEEISTEIQMSAALKQGFCNYMKQMHDNGTSVDLARDAKALHARAEDIGSNTREISQSQVIRFDSVGRCQLSYSPGHTQLGQYDNSCTYKAEIGSIRLAGTAAPTGN